MRLGLPFLESGPWDLEPTCRHAWPYSRWYPEVRGGKHVVVVVVSGPPDRHWIITAYLARRLAEGEAEWKRS